MIKDDNVTEYTFNALDQLVSEKTTSENEVISDKTYTYDANGNQTKSKDSVTGDATEMEYNEIDMMTGLRMEENGRVMLEQENVYTNLGQRIKKTDTKYTYEEGETEGAAESEARRYLYANGSLVGTADDDGNLTTFNILTPEGSIISSSRIAENSEEKWYLYSKDDLGSTTSIIGEDGNLAAAYEYDEYGNIGYKVGEDFDNEICYTGQILDKNTGLYYYNARFYDPESGTFTTQDTYRGEQINPLTQNLYAYCAGNPVNNTDPTGHSWLGRQVRKIAKQVPRSINKLKSGFRTAKKAATKGAKSLIKSVKKYGGVIALNTKSFAKKIKTNTAKSWKASSTYADVKTYDTRKAAKTIIKDPAKTYKAVNLGESSAAIAGFVMNSTASIVNNVKNHSSLGKTVSDVAAEGIMTGGSMLVGALAENAIILVLSWAATNMFGVTVATGLLTISPAGGIILGIGLIAGFAASMYFDNKYATDSRKKKLSKTIQEKGGRFINNEAYWYNEQTQNTGLSRKSFI